MTPQRQVLQETSSAYEMSILIDDREDNLLLDHISRFGLPVTVCRLDFGDIAIESSGGRLIGYERKRLPDLISSMTDRRLSGFQLRGMYSLYDHVELIVEGVWRAGDSGEIEVPNGRSGGWQTLYHQRSGISYRQVDSFLYSQYQMGGVPYWRTGSTSETANLIASRFHWWQKDIELHKSHDVLYTNNPTAQRRGAVIMQQGAPSPVTMLAAQIPGIDATAWDIGKHFKSPFEMAAAGVREWRECSYTDRKGNVKHFGLGRAREIVRWMRGEKE